MERETTISLPDAYLPLLEDIRLLSGDQQNPNHTTINQQEQIWKSLQKYGWAYPIITNKAEFTLMESREHRFVCSIASFMLLFYGCQ